MTFAKRTNDANEVSLMIKPLTETEEPEYAILADSSQRALEWSAVLESQSIPYEVQNNPVDGTRVFILEEEHYGNAVKNIDEYENERPFFERFRELFTATPAPLRFKMVFKTGVISKFIDFRHEIGSKA